MDLFMKDAFGDGITVELEQILGIFVGAYILYTIDTNNWFVNNWCHCQGTRGLSVGSQQSIRKTQTR